MPSALHHLNKRKRIHQKKEKYPHPKKWKRSIDKLVYIIAIAGPIVSLAQVYEIWYHKTAVGVSLITWIGYFLGAFVWLAYGIAHNEKPLILNSVLWIIIEAMIVVGIVLYG
jgi:uncharacterized protein with PQ loop repeat